MGVRTTLPVVGKLTENVRGVGSLVEPEEKKFEVNLRVNGWIEKLYANKEGMAVQAGMPLFELYSPEVTAAADELITAQKAFDATTRRHDDAAKANGDEYLEKGAQSVLDAGRRKLLLMGLTKDQIDAIQKMDKAPATVTITSPIQGHISEKRVVEGGAVKAMDRLMEISDRSAMWLIVEVFEQQIGAVKVGQKVQARVDALPGKVFEGKVDFIYPHLETATRTARVRVELPNEAHELRQGMFAEATIEETAADDGILVPREAVLDTGQRQVVFVALGGGRFEGRDVQVGRTGIVAGGDERRYVAVTGIGEKDAVVTSGQFLLDSESRLEEARRKFLMPAGMPGMDMSGGGGK
jgi:RND family efflux transporter MFP subunit